MSFFTALRRIHALPQNAKVAVKRCACAPEGLGGLGFDFGSFDFGSLVTGLTNVATYAIADKQATLAAKQAELLKAQQAAKLPAPYSPASPGVSTQGQYSYAPSSGTSPLLIAGGVAALGAVGYFLLRKKGR
jgi:hypothetical protein